MPFYARTLLITARPADAQDAIGRHREQLRELAASGKLHAAGELGKEDGFLDILSVKDRLEAEEITRSSPLVDEGLATWMVREWTPTTAAMIQAGQPCG